MLMTSIIRIFLTRSFKPFIFRKVHSNQLFYQDLENVGLYVHIPFCESICDFCPYFKVKYDETLAKEYIDAVIKEINLVCSKQEGKKTVTSLYFGGGTPALVLAGLQKIINKLKEYFIIKEGIGVELHPENICENTLYILKSFGVNMVSIGIQSFDSNCLNMLGRKDNKFIEKLELVKLYGFPVIDVDLISICVV